MDKFRYNGSIEDVEKEYNGVVVDCIEGCLIDSVLIETVKGYVALIETFVNCWVSNYTLYSGKAEVVDILDDYKKLVEETMGCE